MIRSGAGAVKAAPPPTRYRHSGRRDAERLEDPEPSGAREREAVGSTVREQIAFGAAGFRVYASLRSPSPGMTIAGRGWTNEGYHA